MMYFSGPLYAWRYMDNNLRVPYDGWQNFSPQWHFYMAATIFCAAMSSIR